MQTVAETSLFVKQAAALFTDDERKDLIDFLATHPQAGDEIPGAGGVRKLRFGAKGKGKRAAHALSMTGTATMRPYMRFSFTGRTKRRI